MRKYYKRVNIKLEEIFKETQESRKNRKWKKKNKQQTRTQTADLIMLSTDCLNTPFTSRE